MLHYKYIIYLTILKSVKGNSFCCFGSEDNSDRCNTCWKNAIDTYSLCSRNERSCLACSKDAIWCKNNWFDWFINKVKR